jgi:NTE family protein
VEIVETGSEHDKGDRPQAGIALCLSGGGYRAMLFHVGALWRLNEFGYLQKLARVSSVSGGSITAAFLGLRWKRLSFDAAGVATAFVAEVVDPIRRFARDTIDISSVVSGVALPGSIADKLAKAYRDHLFGHATLQDLPPDSPRFVINATNVQSGALWRFSRPYMADYRVGYVPEPGIELAVAVAASSAYPPFLSPLTIKLDPASFAPPALSADLHREPYLSHVVLTDGGVYDNLGLETAWKRYQTVLVSDGGGKMAAEDVPRTDWLRHSHRVLELIDNQVRSLRKRQVIGSFENGTRTGAYWGMRTNIAHYGLSNALPCPPEKTMALAELETRLKALDPATQERLVNWGYAVCDAAVRAHVNGSLQPATGFPYPTAGLG